MVFASTGVHVVQQAPQNACCQCLHPLGELQLPPASRRDSLGSAGGSDPGSFQMIASACVLGRVRFCVSPLRVECLFSTALWVS